MNKIIKLLFVLIISSSLSGHAQTNPGDLNGGINTIYTALPFLRINPDGRSGGMGDLGIATSPDPASIYYNASKLAFAEEKTGLAISYNPWLRAWIPDMFIGHITGYTKLNDRNAVAASFRYFHLGNSSYYSYNIYSDYYFFSENKPSEFIFDLTYSSKITEHLSAGLTLKYIHSNLPEVSNGFSIDAIATDLSLFYQKEQIFNGTTFAAGIAITNIGPKVSYLNNAVRDFIPTNLGIGTAYTVKLNHENSLMLGIDVNKLLVPTPDTLSLEGNPYISDHREKPLISGILGSFTDAPGGLDEELRELMFSFGIEYWHKKCFALRAGYFNEHRTKGNRQFITLGTSFRYKLVGLNFSYLFPTTTTSSVHPLKNTFRISLFVGLSKDKVAG